mgnify:CR=1 FL=1
MQINHLPIATISIILLNGLIFVVGLLSGEQTHIIEKYGFIPDQYFNPRNVENNNDQQNSLPSLQPSEPQILFPPLPDSLTRLVASMFLHANIAHIAFNLLALAYLGTYAERSIGIPTLIATWQQIDWLYHRHH